MPLLSVIVPVYRKEPYLEKCITTILAQTLSDLELILIDDGSPDRCGEICDAFAATDDRVVVIHQKNMGVSAARNAGLQVAKGEFLGFVDADDWVSPEMYEKLMRTAVSANADIAACAITVRSEAGEVLRKLLVSERSYDRRQMLEELFSTPDQLGGTCCNKIFRRSTVADARFPVGVTMCEDRIYLLQCYARCDKCVKISDALSQVVETTISATRGQSAEPMFAILESSRRMIRLATDVSTALRGEAVSRYLDDVVRYLKIIKKTARENGEPWRVRSIPHLLHALRWIAQCYLTGMIPRDRVRGCLFGLLHL